MNIDERATPAAAAPAAPDSASEPLETLTISRAKRPEGKASPDGMLLQGLRSGKAEAGYRLVRDHYPRIFHYLLCLTGRREVAEDLTQETFLQAWRRLDAFDDRLALGPWLCQIARREFLQALRRRRSETSLEDVAEVAALRTCPETDGVELRAMLAKLPRQQREIVVLHDLEGYTSAEIARIVGMPAGTVRYRLSEARERLRAELGEGDLLYLNEPSMPMRQWNWLSLDQMHALATRLTRTRAADRQAPGQGATTEETMERREFLRQAAVSAAGLMLTEPEKEVIDPRLTQKVTCAFKGTALTDLCAKLNSDTDIHLVAGPSVADEKVTLFCEKRPLREVMRQLSRPFGYTWLRSGRPGQYRYELVQDLRSQLLEEELRNRDRNAALLAMQQAADRFRPLLHLSPDEALAQAETAHPEEKLLLERLAHTGWGPLQMYFRLSPQQMAALRNEDVLAFSGDPAPGQEPLPPDLAIGVLQSCREWQAIKTNNGVAFTTNPEDPKALPLTDVPDVHPQIRLWLQQSELGQFNLAGQSGYVGPNRRADWVYGIVAHDGGNLAVGQSPATLQPKNGIMNAKLANDPALRSRVSLQPEGRYPAAAARPDPGGPATASKGGQATERKVTSADVLEALHCATGMPIVADFYTRLYEPEGVSVRDQPLFDALNHLADAMRLRWHREREGGWLQFRSASYYHDRLKEVPNRLLRRWQAVRRERGMLTLDDLVEIARLPDAQLDARDMAEGARTIWGMEEWDLVREGTRAHVRYLSSLTPDQRQEAQRPSGLGFTQMTLTQQQQFLANAIPAGAAPLQSVDELAGSVLRVDYTQPGWFEWPAPESFLRWVVTSEPGPAGRRELRAPIRERTQQAALEALSRVEPHLREVGGKMEITPTRYYLAIVYIPGGTSKKRPLRVYTSLEWVGVADF